MPPCGRRETTMAKLERIGLQLYTIRDYLADEEGLKVALEKVKSLGYDELHTCGLRGISHETLGRLCREAGLTVVGSHDDFGLMVSDPEKAVQVMKEAGVVAKITEALAVAIDDTPGGFAAVVHLLSKQNFEVKYMYASVGHIHGKALMILGINDPTAAESIIKETDAGKIDPAEIYRI